MKRSLALVFAASLAIGLATPALGADLPVPGSACTQSGEIVVTNKTSMICQLAGADLKWSKKLVASTLPISMADAWIKSAEKTAMMTGAFGTFINPTNKPVKVIGAYVSKSISKFSQLHEVVMAGSGMAGMKMQEKAGGFTIPAKGTYQLKPGSDHTMVMGLAKDIVPGSIVRIVYITDTGARFAQNFLAKFYAGGNETYDETPANTSAVSFTGTSGQAAGVTIVNPVFRKPDAMMAVKDSTGVTYKTGGFMVIENKGKTDATLVGGSSNYGDLKVGVDETVGTNQWTPMTNGLTVKAGASVKMRMKGYHITITGIPYDVPAGKKVNVTLKFSDGSTIDTVIKFMVIPSTDPTYGFAM